MSTEQNPYSNSHAISADRIGVLAQGLLAVFFVGALQLYESTIPPEQVKLISIVKTAKVLSPFIVAFLFAITYNMLVDFFNNQKEKRRIKRATQSVYNSYKLQFKEIEKKIKQYDRMYRKNKKNKALANTYAAHIKELQFQEKELLAIQNQDIQRILSSI